MSSDLPKVILLLENSRASGRGLLRGIARYAHINGPWRFVQSPPFYVAADVWKRHLKTLKDSGAAGIIARDSVADLDQILSSALPTVIAAAVHRHFGDVPTIVGNNEAIGRMGAEFFLSRGFRNFAFSGIGDIFWSHDRCKAFCSRVAESGFCADTWCGELGRGRSRSDDKSTALVKWLISLPKPLALMACNDECGRQVVEACVIAGLKVPEEVAVLGVDNDELMCVLSEPPLSSIELNAERAGYEAAEILDKLMRGETTPSKRIVVQPKRIVIRRSSDIVAIEDPVIADAIRYIETHRREYLLVSSVAEAVMVSQRTLQKRFRKALGRSVRDEIRRSRIDLASKMLTETNLPVKQVARKLGYSSSKHISRYFKKAKNMSVSEYRRRFGRI